MRKTQLLIAALFGTAGLFGATTASAQCIADSFEPNDSCAAASILLPGRPWST